MQLRKREDLRFISHIFFICYSLFAFAFRCVIKLSIRNRYCRLRGVAMKSVKSICNLTHPLNSFWECSIPVRVKEPTWAPLPVQSRTAAGAVVPNAKVAILDLATNTPRETKTNAQGEYRVFGLGSWQIQGVDFLGTA